MTSTTSATRPGAPASGDPITMRSGRLDVPDQPIIPFIEGDGTGPDIWRASRIVFDAAVARAYGGTRAIAWHEVLAGEKSKERLDNWLPDETLASISKHLVAIKGPLTTPVGGGFRSLNVTLRQKLDLYACVRPALHRRPSRSAPGRRQHGDLSREHGGHLRRSSTEGRPRPRLIAFLREEMVSLRSASRDHGTASSPSRPKDGDGAQRH